MGIVPTDRLEGDADARALRRDARTTIRALQALRERSVNRGRRGAVDLRSSASGGAHVSESAVA